MRGNKKITSCLQIVLYLHLIFCNTFMFSAPAWAADKNEIDVKNKDVQGAKNKSSDSEDSQEKILAADISSAGSLLSQNDKIDAVINNMVNSSTGKATADIEQWLQQYGTARVNIGVDRQFSLASADFDFLIPFYDNNQNLIFSQSGVRRADERNLMNLGLGYRHFADNWMWGINTFYDQQLSGNTHQRAGVGAELGWDYLKLSANGYMRLSGWKDSRLDKDYEERVANGYDLRSEGYLPAWPQLGMQLMWEQYYGKDVALMGNDKDQRQRNPYAATVGLNYTPVPLVTLGVNHKAGKGNKHDTQAEINFNWMAGIPFDDQIDGDNVQARRTLRGSRLDLVSRNNNIVLEYRKKELISLSLPQHIEGEESQTLPIAVKISSKYPLSHIVWQDSNLISHGGKITESHGEWSIVLPDYQPNGAEKNIYVISAMAYDSKGNQSDKAWISVEVKGFNLVTATTQTTTSNNNLLADGISSTPVTLTITSGTGKLVSGVAGQLSTQLIHLVSAKRVSAKSMSATQSAGENITPFIEQSPGVYVSQYTSGTIPGTVVIQPRYNRILLSKTTITLLATNSQFHFAQMDVNRPAALANGQDVITVTAKVINTRNHAPAAGVPVTWGVENPDAILSAAQSVSDEQGNATVLLTSKAVLEAAVTAQLENGDSVKTAALQFTTDVQTAQVTKVDADKQAVKANGQDAITLSAHVIDASNHPLANQPVKWAIVTSTNSVHLSDSQSTTDASGVATILLTSSQAGDAVVSAVTGASAAASSATLTFTADVGSAVLGTLSASKTTALADGHDEITLNVKVEDANKNPVKGVKVSWLTASGTAQLSAADATTDEKGEVAVSVTSAAVEAMQISAKLADKIQISPMLNFMSDSATAKVKTVQADKTQATANDNDRITLLAKVVDSSDHPVAAGPLKWTIVQGQATLSDTQTTADAQGESSVTLISAHPGTVVISASSTTGVAVNASDLTFVADTATAKVTAVTVDKTQALANGSDTVTYSATVKDAEGNPLNDQVVNWGSTPATAKLSGATSRTDASGVATMTLTTKIAGEVKATAKAGNGTVWNAPTVMFIADSSTAQLSGLKVNKQIAVGNGVDSITIGGQITDQSGNPLNNVEAAWSVTPTNGVLSVISASSDAQGVVTVVLTSTHIQSYRVKGTVNGDEEISVPVTFNADNATAAVRTLTADKATDITAGRDTVTLTALVKDNNGLPVEGATVTWSGDNANGQFSSYTSTTDSSGNASVTYGSTLVVPTVISANTGSNTPKTLALTLVPDLQTAAPGAITVDKSSATANGSDRITLTTLVKDQYGNLVTQEPVDWQVVISPMDYTLSSSEQLTDAAGQSSVTLASNDRGLLKAVATFNSNKKTSPLMAYVSDTATEKVSSIVATQTVNVVAGKDVVTLHATVTDDNENPVANAVVYWGTDNNSGVFQPDDSSTTNLSGVAEITYTATTVQPTVIGAGINHTKKTLTVQYVADESTAHLVTMKADKTRAVADGQERVTWMANVKDSNGNNVPGAAVNWSSDNPALTLNASSGVTDATGNVSVFGYTTKAAEFKVSATLPGLGGIMTAVPVQFIGDSKTATLTTLTSNKKTVAANADDTVQYTATVKDSNGNLVPDAEVTWAASINKLTSGSSKTSSQGVALGSLKGHDIGQVTVTAAINSTNRQVDDVVFVNNIDGIWVINSAYSEYTSPPVSGFPNLGFVTVLPTVGPTELDWGPNGYSDVATPVMLVAADGKQYTAKFKGYRESICKKRPLNAATTCEATDAPITADFSFDKVDNPSLPAGHYMGFINFMAKDMKSSYTFNYKLTVDLTVN